MTNDLRNHGASWSVEDKKFLKSISKDWTTHEELFDVSERLAQLLGRTESAVCNQIEQIKEWHYRDGDSASNHPDKRA